MLDGRVALVTGGARGIGRAICETLASNGARIAVNYRSSEPEARTLLKRLRRVTEAEAYRADVASPQEVGRMVRAVRGRFGRIDILVNNASYSSPAGWKVPLRDISAREFQQTLDVDLKGTLLCTQAAAAAMRRQKRRRWRGKIINFASAAAIAGDPTTLLYSAAKMGVVGLTRALARELAPDILVNAVAPGSIRTHWLEQWRLTARDLSELRAEIPAGRLGEPREVAEVVLFLASPRADFITGQTWVVDGGATLR